MKTENSTNRALSAEAENEQSRLAPVISQSHFTNTPGGWKYRSDVVGKGYYIETVDMNHRNTFIGDVGGGLQSRSEIKANAKLIASAPALINALLSAKRELDLVSWQNIDVYEQVHSAIELAIGIDLRNVPI